jgi:hypothetical protein
VSIDQLAGWGLLVFVLLGAAALIGLLTARLFLSATGTRSDRGR